MNQTAFVFLFLFSSHLYALSDTCSWCTTKNQKAIEEIIDLSARSPADQLKSVRSKGICVKVVGKGMKLPPEGFFWGNIEKPEGSWDDVTLQRGLLAKMLCRGEKPIANKCATIALEARASKVALARELLHYRQMEMDPAWCPLAKSLWTRTATPQENQIIQNKFWDSTRTLWENRKKLRLSDEDSMLVYASMVSLARLRGWFDPGAQAYIKKQGIEVEMKKLSTEMAKKLKRK